MWSFSHCASGALIYSYGSYRSSPDSPLCDSDVCRLCHLSLALLSSVSINRAPTTTPHPALYECPRPSLCSLRLSNTDTQALCLCHNIFSPSFNPFFFETLKEEVARGGLHGNGRGEKSEKKKAFWRSLFLILFFFFLVSLLSLSFIFFFSSQWSQSALKLHLLSVCL